MCRFESCPGHHTEVVELVDTHVSGACVARHEGSSPSFGTFVEGLALPALCFIALYVKLELNLITLIER